MTLPPVIRLDAKTAPRNGFSRGVAVIPQAMGHAVLIAEVLALRPSSRSSHRPQLRPAIVGVCRLRRFYTAPWGGSDGNAFEANVRAFQQLRRRDVKVLTTVAAISRRYRTWER